jgi:dienelactone hydrolase
MGPFWSMRLVGSKLPVDEQYLDLPLVSTVRLSASQRGRTLATATLIRRRRGPGVSVRDMTLTGQGFDGCYYSPPASSRPSPAILFLGGSEGGLPCYYEPGLLASHGYPTLALAYFGAPGLPADLKRIPLEYFEHALEWLAKQPGVDPNRLVVIGVSRGGEAALLLGTVYPSLIHAVVSYVGSSVVGPSPSALDAPAWTLHGKPVPHETGNDLGNTDPRNKRAIIPVEKIAGPIFIVSAVMDGLWPSYSYATAIVTRLRAHRRTDYTSLVYYEAGHAGNGVPNIPVGDVFASRYGLLNLGSRYGLLNLGSRYGLLNLGGSLSGDAHARADSWPRLLAFLKRLGNG